MLNEILCQIIVPQNMRFWIDYDVLYHMDLESMQYFYDCWMELTECYGIEKWEDF